MEGAVANDLTDTIVQIQHRGETKVYPTRAQLGPKHITCFRRQPHRSQRVLRPKLAEDAHGRNGRKAISAKTLYAAAFVIDGDQQRLIAFGMNGLAQGRKLFTVIKMTCKQNNAAHQWIAQVLTLMVSQYRTFHIHHHRAGRQALARSAVCHRLASVKFLGAKSSASTTTKAATVSVSSVTEIWALTKRSAYQLASGSDSCTQGLTPGPFSTCQSGQVMGLCMPTPKIGKG